MGVCWFEWVSVWVRERERERERVCAHARACYKTFLKLHANALLKAMVYNYNVWFNHNVMDVVNVVMFHLVIISDARNEFLPGNNKDVINWTELNWIVPQGLPVQAVTLYHPAPGRIGTWVSILITGILWLRKEVNPCVSQCWDGPLTTMPPKQSYRYATFRSQVFTCLDAQYCETTQGQTTLHLSTPCRWL